MRKFPEATKAAVAAVFPLERRDFGTRAAYMAALGSWAAETLSGPEPSWRGPGTYRFNGYRDDDGRPVATLEKVNA